VAELQWKLDAEARGIYLATVLHIIHNNNRNNYNYLHHNNIIDCSNNHKCIIQRGVGCELSSGRIVEH